MNVCNCNFSCKHIQVLSASIDWPCNTLVRGVLKGEIVELQPTNIFIFSLIKDIF